MTSSLVLRIQKLRFLPVLLCTVSLGILLLSSCGYSIQNSKASLGGVKAVDGEVEKIYIPVVDNLSVRTGIEPDLTTALREALSALNGVQVVNRPEEARFLLLGSLQSYNSVHGVTPITGDSTSGPSGGLGVGQVIMGDVVVNIEMQIKLVEKIPESPGVERLVWSRRFAKSGTYTASTRFSELQGSAAGPNINASREIIQVRILAKNLAQDVLDQVVQNF